MKPKPEVTLSIIVPVYNEEATVGYIIDRVRNAGIVDYELIVVDDGSTDKSRVHAKKALERSGTLVVSSKNEGKTAAVRKGLEVANGTYVIVQDADLEYSPSSIPPLLDCAKKTTAVVYGRRPACWNNPKRWLLAVGVLGIDILIWIVHRHFVRDHACCYKLLPRDTMQRLHLESTGFEGCIEITSKLIRSGIQIHQVPVCYAPRLRSEGKKLTVLFGFRAVAALWRYRNWSPPVNDVEK